MFQIIKLTEIVLFLIVGPSLKQQFIREKLFRFCILLNLFSGWMLRKMPKRN